MGEVLVSREEVKTVVGLLLGFRNFVKLLDYHFLLYRVRYFLCELGLNKVTWPVLSPFLKIFL